MTTEAALRGLELRSLITEDGRLELSLHDVDIPEPGPDEVVVRIEATPIHPSDIGLLLGAVDPKTFTAEGTADRPVVSGTLFEERRNLMASRFGQSLPVGNEGAGTVVKTGENAKALMGKTVAIAIGAMYAQYRVARAADCMVLPDGMPAAKGAAAYVNPMTALSIAETARDEGYKALIHTAAASTLGQMLVRICLADGVPLVNIVRSDEQVELLRSIGAQYVLNSRSPDFMHELTDAIAETEALVAFDAIGGGKLAGQILTAMERALGRRQTEYSRYGSDTHKQVYIYGGLDVTPTIIDRSTVGMYWGVDSFMLGPFLKRVGRDGRKRLEARVAAELETTFAIHYTAEVSLAELLSPENLAAVVRRATGEKFLIVPHKGG